MLWLIVAGVLAVVLGWYFLIERPKNARTPGIATTTRAPGIVLALVDSGDAPVDPVKPKVKSGSPMARYTGSLTGGMLPGGGVS